MQIRLNTDLASGGLGLAIAGLFWSQRGTMSFLSSVFPDTVIAILALISAALVVRGFVTRDTTAFELSGNGRLVATVAIFALWWIGISNLGFVTTSVPLFTALALMLIAAARRPGLRDVVVTLIVAGAISYGFFWVFTEVLGIRPFRTPFI